ncbi:MAG: hypothetical protein ACYDGR_03345 [Candidatus Dormibacteria bacterium]
MATNLTVLLSDRPGIVAEASEALARAGIELLGCSCFVVAGHGWGYLLVDRAEGAHEALEGIADVAEVREVVTVDIEGPAAIGRVSRQIADAGVNMKFLYVAAGSRLVVAAEDLDAVRRAVSGAPSGSAVGAGA